MWKGSSPPTLREKKLTIASFSSSEVVLFFSGEKRLSEKNKGVWKTQGRGKHTIKPLPKNSFGPPPPMIRFPPPSVRFHPVVFLRGNRHRPGKSHFLRPPKLVLEGALYGTFPPPQNRTIRFAPPLAAGPSLLENSKEKHSKKKDALALPNPKNHWERRGKTLQKARKIECYTISASPPRPL